VVVVVHPSLEGVPLPPLALSQRFQILATARSVKTVRIGFIQKGGKKMAGICAQLVSNFQKLI
jgi:hypothetical protein